ncbi:MAG: alpha-ribazole phosphatase [Bacteroidales bacterium]|nr:alpha-ribazole phosphatase [Bacteroidales bacterium]
MEIYLIRHTTVDVPPGYCYGRTNVPLKESFEMEAQHIKDQIESLHFDKIYCSPAERCTRLSKYLFGNDYITDDRVREMSFGVWEGGNWNDIVKEEADQWMKDWINLPTPGGESLIEMKMRVEDFFNELYKTNHTRVAVVTHSGVQRLFKVLRGEYELKQMFEIEVAFGEVMNFKV